MDVLKIKRHVAAVQQNVTESESANCERKALVRDAIVEIGTFLVALRNLGGENDEELLGFTDNGIQAECLGSVEKEAAQFLARPD
jgi:hypothetical protein